MALWGNIGSSEMQVGGFRGLHESIAPASRPLGLISRVSNLQIEPAPALSTRQGLSLVGAAQPGVVRGIHRYSNLSGSTVHLIAGFGANLMRYDTGTGAWSSIGTLTDARWTAANIASSSDFAVFFDGTQPKKWNGSSLTNLSNAPKGRYVVEAYQQLFVAGIPGRYVVEAYQQLFVAGIPGRENDLDFCDVALPEMWNPSPTNDAGSITVGTAPIRWLGFDRVQGKVLIWTTRSVKQLNGPETPNRPNLWAIRTVAHEGTPCGFTVQYLAEAGSWVWLADDAFCVWAGGQLMKVIEPIKASFALIDWSKISDAASWVTQQGEYVCSVPKISGGVVWFIFNPAIGWLTGAGPDIRASAAFEFGGRMETVIGDADGKVYTVGGSDDAGSAIAWSAEIGPTVMETGFEQKHLLAVHVILTLGTGATANAALSLTETGETWGTAYTLSGSANYGVIRVPVPPTRGRIFRLKVWGTGEAVLHDVRLRFATGRS